MLFLAGMGLTPAHISKEVDAVLRQADTVYYDVYTVPGYEKWLDVLGKEYGKVVPATRNMLEDEAWNIVEEARDGDMCVLVPGDPFAATTHVSLALEAEERGVAWRYLPGVSIITVAASLTGLHHYKFGATVTVPREWSKYPSWRERMDENRERGLHTLLLLDVGLDVEDALRAVSGRVAVIARACEDTEKIRYGEAEELVDEEWGGPPYCIVVPGTLHPLEEEFLRRLM